ncbi:putative RNA-directed DNA polymerase [Rosa chinensis]|uniref:Putative RNA-directed DNA polymerase n=1 Tax=Rosa chinensis TaxID=74649 RepID=A0A2P6SB79_ROSCH|nr:putative RNA-directed DNA polymerase [Rosa chinensis]
MHTKFDYVVCSTEESHDIDEVSIDELQSSLLVHEQRINQGATTEEQALKVSSNTPVAFEGVGRGQGRGRGRFNSYSRGRGRGQGSRFDKSNIECFNCHRYGHYRSECPTFFRGQGERSNYAEIEEEETTLLRACHNKEEKSNNLWYLDSGCSNHMCGNKLLFSDLDESFRDIVKFGDNSTVSVMGKGSINVRMKNDVVERVPSVFYVPDLKSNLLSLGQLQEKVYHISIKNGVCLIEDSTRGVIARVKMTSNRLFPIIIQDDGPSLQTCFSAKVKDLAWLWHFRYGHLNFNGLQTLRQKSMVTGLPHIVSPSQVCEDCIVGKQHRDHFPRGNAWRALNPLELVHSDICEPINPTSNGGKRYFITFIDDYSRKTWVYFLQKKSEAFVAFKSFKALVENEVGRTIKVLQTDRGGEFNSKEFASFCEMNGIRRQLTAAYTPQQNGVSERKNHTILNMPLGYVQQGNEEKVYKLKKALYGLKQAPRAWYSRIESYFTREGFEKCPYEHTLFIKSGAAGKFLIVCLYVDDLIYTGNDEDLFKSFKHSMMAEFEMTDLGLLHYFLSIEVVQSATGIFIMQKKYAVEILDRFEMKTCNSVGPPIEPGLKLTKDPKGKKVDNTLFKQIVGSLMYLTATRPDIMYAVSLINRYMEHPTEHHLSAAKRVLRYLKGTIDFGIFYKKGEMSELVGFTDSDYAGDLDDRRSTSGYVFMLSGNKSCF